MRVAFIGLGVMGAPIAGHIADAGHEVVVFNRTRSRAEAWLSQYAGVAAPTPAAAARDAQAAFVCVTDDTAFDAVLDGSDGLLAGLPAGAIVVDHGSGGPDRARARAAAMAKRGIGCLDAPVTGGQRAAETGTLSIMVGGAAAHLSQVAPVVQAYARDIMLMGDAGAGHLTKLVNVIIGGGTGLAVAEGLSFAMQAGLDVAQVRKILLEGSSYSWQLDHRGEAMIARDYRPRYPLSLGRKDVGNALRAGQEAGAVLPVTQLAAEILRDVAEAKGAGLDVASIIEYFLRSDRRAAQ